MGPAGERTWTKPVQHEFVPSPVFLGARQGYVFKNGMQVRWAGMLAYGALRWCRCAVLTAPDRTPTSTGAPFRVGLAEFAWVERCGKEQPAMRRVLRGRVTAC